MIKRYCHKCAYVVLGFNRPSNISSLSGTAYQLSRYMKHTAPSSRAIANPVNSIFDNPTYSSYKNYVVNAAASGWAELDNQGRVNMAWYAGSKNRITYHKGTFYAPTDGVKVVLLHDASRIHAFPIADSSLSAFACGNCGANVPY